jgi:hypothetical protein
MKKTFCLILLVMFSICITNSDAAAKSHRSIAAHAVNSVDIPDGISFEGKFVNAFSWTDRLSKNLVVMSETGIEKNDKFPHSDKDNNDAELFACHYILSGNSATKTWCIYDYVADCSCDLFAKFLPDALSISDLNNNGIAEVWIIYRKMCRGDIGPANMKIIMHEGTKKYVLRGTTKAWIGTDENGKAKYDGGDYTMDAAMLRAPKSFRTHAAALWNKNIHYPDPK